MSRETLINASISDKTFKEAGEDAHEVMKIMAAIVSHIIPTKTWLYCSLHP